MPLLREEQCEIRLSNISRIHTRVDYSGVVVQLTLRGITAICRLYTASHLAIKFNYHLHRPDGPDGHCGHDGVM